MITHTLTPPNKSQKQQLFEHLVVLCHSFAKAEDDTNTHKMAELARKVDELEFVLGFCGHFSAGKSTMINRIAGVDLLPSNPIPTTANLAKIHSGDTPFARVYFQDSDPVELPFPYELDEIRHHAIDGRVRSIEISHPLQDFESGVTLLDTPGIDSTDDTHRMATESALHLADVIFYVTDYNHVLSEMNLAFLKQLNDQHKRIVLVVNQIDKHSSAEVDLNDYRIGIADAFAAQGIELEHIFYTSLKNVDLSTNQFTNLKTYIHQFIKNKDTLLLENAKSAAEQLILNHIEWRKDQQTDEREQLEKRLQALDEDDRRNLMTEYHALEHKLVEQQNKPNIYFDTAQSDLNKTLASAILMPYETREAGRNYIESIQPDFKMGLFSSKKKTEQERQKRLDHFYEKVTETSSTLDWQVKELLVKEAGNFGIQNEAYKQSIYDLQISLNQDFLTELVQEGATLNAQYVLRYTEQVAEAIKSRYRKIALQQLEAGKAILEQDSLSTVELFQSSLAKLNENRIALDKLQQLDSELDKERQQFNAILDGQIDSEKLNVALAEFPEKNQRPAITKSYQPKHEIRPCKEPSVQIKKSPDKPETSEAQKDNFQQRLIAAAKQLKQTSGHIASIKGLQTLAQDMSARAKRLENNRYTIALFGAFSAGKSSFANALIGKKVLPVSPNPTTAAINKILPADDEHPNETASVQFKQEHEMLADVQKALKPHGETLKHLNELPHVLRKINSRSSSFLHAINKGMAEIGNRLGTKQTIDLETFYDIVANEPKAVFVESIALYIDCPLTRQGITLVDTPGADSINARHTGVAFDYIKNADAILFVTYYNHAFSQADREFLIQLGRVKESFAMDKMFFIVNAADLAASENELVTVADYVHNNLVSYGIHNPRIYPISSQRALVEKQAIHNSSSENPDDLTESGMGRFEYEFRQFTMDELTNIAVQAAHEDINRAVQTLDSYISSAQENENVRQRKRKAVLQTKNEIDTFIRNLNFASEQRALKQEIEQLIYYVQQRVFLRYIDLFKETFNPAQLGLASQNKKKILQGCLDELLEIVGFDLAQEMRATTLRIESFINQSLEERFMKIGEKVGRMTSNTILTTFEKPSFDSPEFDNGLQDLSHSDFKDILGLYRNPKQFFERNGKAIMREKLQNQLQVPVTDYLEQAKERLAAFYEKTLNQETEKLQNRLLEQTEEYMEGIIAALSMDMKADELLKTKHAIKTILN